MKYKMNWFKKKKYEEWLEKQKKKERVLEDETVKKILQDKEFVSNLPKEKQKELKTLEIVSIFFMVSFFFIMNYCYKHNIKDVYYYQLYLYKGIKY